MNILVQALLNLVLHIHVALLKNGVGALATQFISGQPTLLAKITLSAGEFVAVTAQLEKTPA